MHVLAFYFQIVVYSSLFSLDHVCSPDYAILPGTPPVLCGKVSRDIKQEIEKLAGDPRVKKLRWFSECLSVSISGVKCELFPVHQNVS